MGSNSQGTARPCNTAVPIDSRAGKEVATAKNVLLFGLFGRGFRYARIINTVSLPVVEM